MLSGQKLTSQAIGTGLESGKGVLAEVGLALNPLLSLPQRPFMQLPEIWLTRAGEGASHPVACIYEPQMRASPSTYRISVIFRSNSDRSLDKLASNAAFSCTRCSILRRCISMSWTSRTLSPHEL